MMTNEEKLKKQLQATMIALARIQGKVFDLSYLIEKEGLDVQHAFDSLVGWIMITNSKARNTIRLIKEEYEEADND